MNLSRIPVWTRWIALAVVCWCMWGVVVLPQFTRRITAANQKHSDCDQQLTALRERIGQTPDVSRAVDSCHRALDSCLSSFGSTHNIDALTTQLREVGKRHGLANPQVAPELSSLLKASHGIGSTPAGQIRLDTLIVGLSAQGSFFALGAWLDDIERRPDFRTWISCQWNRGDDGEGVVFTGRATLITLDVTDSGVAQHRAGL